MGHKRVVGAGALKGGRQGEGLLVTKPYLPALDELLPLLAGAWQRQWVTNNGPLLRELEGSIGAYLGTADPIVVGNATLALQVGVRAMGISGEVITTPFSYVATTSALAWERCTPVHVDIDPRTYNIAPDAVRAAIGPRTEAILATHVFGNPCDVRGLEELAKEKGLALLFDAAHAFGTNYMGRSVMEFGDLSICSFHATKLYHSIEGGGIWAREVDVAERCRYMRNFGHDGPEKFNGVGINAKMSELHAAVGLVMLSHMEEVMRRRREQWERYAQMLGHRFDLMKLTEGTDVYNCAYFPIILASEMELLRVLGRLSENGISARRYFYPALNQLDYVARRHETPVCDDLSRRVLCLPLYHVMSKGDQENVIELILEEIN